MIKLSFCLMRLPHLTREAFQTYWREQHAPLVRQHAEVLRIRRYVQSHTLPEAAQGPLRAVRRAPEPYDGIAELWFDSLEDIARDTPEVRAAGAALLADERTFIDHSRSPIFVVDPIGVIGEG